MKALTILILLSVFFMIGCEDSNSILEPTNDLSDVSLNKGRIILDRKLDDGGFDDKLDLGDVTNPLIKLSKSFTIDGKRGGELFVSHSWLNDQGNQVVLYAELLIPRRAFSGTLDFDMVFDLENYSVQLSPTPYVFDKPLNFTMYFTGVDLSTFVDSQPVFDYLDDETESLVYGPTYLDISKGIIKVWDVQITHFSRYGWTRTTTTK